MDYMEAAIKDFIEESYENLDSMDRDLVALEKTPYDTELLSNIFRTIHTVKGTSVFLGFTKLEELTHAGETLLCQLRDGSKKLSEDITGVLLALVDAVREIVKSVEQDRTEGERNYSGLVELLTLFADGGDLSTETSDTEVEAVVTTPTVEHEAVTPDSNTIESQPQSSPTNGSDSGPDPQPLSSPEKTIEIKQSEQLCTFVLDKHFFGVSVDHVQEVLRNQEMTPVPLAPKEIEGLINLRGQIVTAIDLRTLLNIEERSASCTPMNIVVNTPDGAASLLVDEIGDVLELDNSDFENTPRNLDPKIKTLINGTYKLDDRLLLVLDIKNTFRTVANGELH